MRAAHADTSRRHWDRGSPPAYNAPNADVLTVFEPGESHTLRALQPTRLLLVLAPWPAPGHYADAGGDDPHELPVHATQHPLDDRPS